MSLKKYKSQGKAVEVTVNNKEENSYINKTVSGFRPRNSASVQEGWPVYKTPLKVGTIENGSSCGRWLSIGI